MEYGSYFYMKVIVFDHGRGPVHHAASVCFHSVPMMVIHTVAGRESFVSIAG